MESYLKELAEQGVLGILLVLAIGGLVWMYKDNRKERDERLQDIKLVWKEDIQFRQEIKMLIENLVNLVSNKK